MKQQRLQRQNQTLDEEVYKEFTTKSGLKISQLNNNAFYVSSKNFGTTAFFQSLFNFSAEGYKSIGDSESINLSFRESYAIKTFLNASREKQGYNKGYYENYARSTFAENGDIVENNYLRKESSDNKIELYTEFIIRESFSKGQENLPFDEEWQPERTEVTSYNLTNLEKYTFILDDEGKITDFKSQKITQKIADSVRQDALDFKDKVINEIETNYELKNPENNPQLFYREENDVYKKSPKEQRLNNFKNDINNAPGNGSIDPVKIKENTERMTKGINDLNIPAYVAKATDGNFKNKIEIA